MNCLSPCVEELKSEKLIKRSYLNNGVACVFESAYCVCVFVLCGLHMYMYCGTQQKTLMISEYEKEDSDCIHQQLEE